MNPLQIRLAGLRRRLRLVVTFRGVCWVAALMLLVLALGGLIDWRIHLPDLVRALLLVATLGGAGCVAVRYLIGPLWAKADDLSLALRIEEHYPILNDALASAVQFLEQPAGTGSGISPGMRQEAVQRALGLARGFDFGPVVDTRGVRTAGLSLAVSGLLALVLAVLYPQLAQTGFLRLAHPFGGYDWPRQTQLDIQARARVARGEAFQINATVSGLIPERAVVEYRFESAPAAREVYQISRPEGADTGKLTARLEAGRVQRNFRYQVRANDAASPWSDVEVVPPPQLASLNGRPSPQIHLLYPAYTDLNEQELPDGASSLETVAGTHVTLRAATDRPVVRAWLEYPPEVEPVLTVASNLNALGAPALGGVADLACTRAAVEKRIPARLDENGRMLELNFIARVSGTFALRFEDELGIGNVRLVELRTLQDPVPIVHLQRPSRSQDSLDVLPDAEITIHVQAADPVFALRSVYLEYHGASPSASAELRQPTIGRLPLYDHESAGAAMPWLLSALSGSGLPVAAPPLRLRRQQLEINRRWSIKELGLKEGDVLTLQACADDFDDVTVQKQPGRSQEVELRIVGKNALDIALNEAQAQIQQELLRLQKQQQEALEKVIPAEAFWRNNKGPLQPRHLDDLLQAEQLQQQIRARVGTRQEGLRAEVARVQQGLRDNHLPHSATQDRMQAIANELDRLAREELEQIEPRLTEARKETEMGQAPPRTQSAEDKTKPQGGENRTSESRDKAPLPEARRHQEEVKKTLDELLKLLEPWSSTREVKGEAKAILQEQQDLQKQAEELAGDTRGKEMKDLDPAKKAELEKTAELQAKLAERTSQLLEKLRRLADARPQDDPEGQAMKQAADKGQRDNVAGSMKAAEENLRNNKINEAGAKQAQSKRSMEEVVKALEDKREEDLDRLIKKMKQAEDKLADLADRQELLQKKMKAAAQIADPGQRAEALKRLAREQEQLRQDTQEMVRELSRLRSERASQALSQAGSQMQRASRQMDRGQDADEQQQEALDRLNDAQQELQDNREKAEDELAREKLAKVADMIKGLRARQESLTAEAMRINRAVLEGKQWSRAVLGSQMSLGDAQKELAKETANIARDRLEGAKVFVHLLNKSAEAMEQAAERILARAKKDEPLENDPPAAEDGGGLSLSAETTAAADVERLQHTALRRLDQLLDALKEQNGKLMRAGNQGGSGSGGGGGGGGAQKGADGDNIPPLAQLKALKSLEQEIYERTRDFSKKHANTSRLSNKEQDELKSLRRDQQDIMDLYHEMTAPRDSEGGKK